MQKGLDCRQVGLARDPPVGEAGPRALQLRVSYPLMGRLQSSFRKSPARGRRCL